MLKSIRLRNFKSFLNAELPLAPLTVLIGANASGKSNAVEAIQLLSWIGQGNRLSTIRQEVGERSVRGSVLDLVTRGGDDFSIGCTTTGDDWNLFDASLRVRDREDLILAGERIAGGQTGHVLYETTGEAGSGGDDLWVRYNNFARGGTKPRILCSAGMAILSQLESAAKFQSHHKEAQAVLPKVCATYRRALTDILFLDAQPHLMRGYANQSSHLRPTGENLSGVLFHLIRGTSHARHRDTWERKWRQMPIPEYPDDETQDNRLRLESDGSRQQAILDLVQSLPEQSISAIDFVTTTRGDVMVTLRETFGGTERDYDAALLSDGTLRVLAIAAALLSAPRGGLVVIEEIDNGVHPSRADGLLRSISEIAKARSLSVLISTHNPALLDALPNDAVPNVVFCYRDPEDGSSRLVRLDEIPDYPALLPQGSLGHLLTEGLIDRYAKHPTSPEAKQRQFDEWLTRLRTDAD